MTSVGTVKDRSWVGEDHRGFSDLIWESTVKDRTTAAFQIGLQSVLKDRTIEDFQI